jgi:hypothetical protein
MILADFNGSIPDELRYFIVLIPTVVVLAGVCAAGSSRRRLRHPRREKAAAYACVLCVVGALPVSARAMLDPVVNPYSAYLVQSIIPSSGDNSAGGHRNWATSRAVAADLDRLHLPPGRVLLDDYIGFPIVVASNNPRQFVITSDRDFQSVLADPRGAGVQYILVPEPGVLANLDAVNRQYPGFYETGGGFATLVREYAKQGVNDTTWRLYRLN